MLQNVAYYVSYKLPPNPTSFFNMQEIPFTVEPRFNDLRSNDIPGITINVRLSCKSCSKMYGAGPQYNDLRYNDIPGSTMGMSLTKRKISQSTGNANIV